MDWRNEDLFDKVQEQVQESRGLQELKRAKSRVKGQINTKRRVDHHVKYDTV